MKHDERIEELNEAFKRGQDAAKAMKRKDQTMATFIRHNFVNWAKSCCQMPFNELDNQYAKGYKS